MFDWDGLPDQVAGPDPFLKRIVAADSSGEPTLKHCVDVKQEQQRPRPSDDVQISSGDPVVLRQNDSEARLCPALSPQSSTQEEQEMPTPSEGALTPVGDPAELQQTDIEGTWRVVHSRVAWRAWPSTTAKALGMSLAGKLVRGVVEDVSGVEWLRIKVTGSTRFMQQVWLLVDGSCLGLGKLLEKASTMDGTYDSIDEHNAESHSIYMCTTANRGVSLFANRSFEAGEVVLEDEPLITRPKPKDVKSYQVLSTSSWSKAFAKISEPLRFPGEEAPTEAQLTASTAMVRDAIGYVEANANVRQWMQELSCPPLDSSHPLVKVARAVAKLCVARIEICKQYSLDEVHKAILVMEMNLFAGGLLFRYLSRINHSCSPNVVYVGSSRSWKFKALRPIRCGEELCHSYLGEELLLPTVMRQRLLWRSKCFECSCERCISEADPMRAIACEICLQTLKVVHIQRDHDVAVESHVPPLGTRIATARMGERWISTGKENVNPRGESYVQVIRGDVKGWISTNATHIVPDERATEKHKDDQYSHVWNETIKFIYPDIESDDSSYEATHFVRKAYKMFHIAPACTSVHLRKYCCQTFDNVRGVWRCKTCGHERASQHELLQVERDLGRLAERAFFKPEVSPAIGVFNLDAKSEDLCFVKPDFCARALDLARTVIGIFGSEHWTVQWARIFLLDLVIARHTYHPVGRHLTSVVVLELLTNLNALWRWLESLGLAHEPTCFLHSRIRAALKILGGMKHELGHLSAYMYKQLVDRMDRSTAQIEILRFRPVIVEGQLIMN